MATPSRGSKATVVALRNRLSTSVRKKKRRTADEIKNTLSELISITARESMSGTGGGNSRPVTRSANKKTSSTDPIIDLSGSPVLRGKKRKSSTVTTAESEGDEPAAKRMAEDKILDAIKVVNNSVNAMESRMKSFATRADLSNLVDEIKEVKEKVVVNSINIEKLFDMRKEDQDGIHKKLEEIVDSKLSSGMGAKNVSRTTDQLRAEQEAQFQLGRRSIRIWPISEVNDLEESVRTFFKRYLKIPPSVADGAEIELIKRQDQPRRSKIQREVLVRFKSIQARDTIHSYAANLADFKGTAGLRLEIPDFLRGVFRRFESHGAALRNKYGQVKRSVRFDDANMSLLMDVKLEDTQWHRLTASDVASVVQTGGGISDTAGTSAEEKRKILFRDEEPTEGGSSSR